MAQELDFSGKIALVTGAKQGIGRHTAVRLAQCGASVAVMDISISDDDEVCKEIAAQGAACLAISGDVSDADSVAACFAAVLERFGRLDILVNNAGITRDGMVSKMTKEKFMQVLSVNLLGTFLCSQQAFSAMKDTGGSIINFSSIAAILGNPGQSNYSASKGGVISLTRTLALEGARKNIRVNAVVPGFIDTPMTAAMPEENKKIAIAKIPLARMGTTEDVANAVLFFASDMSSFVTGQYLQINGGRSM